eukprot:COSAG01_NODE_379_length_17872_cov_8.030102_17_plen_130_part_00
MDQLVKEGIELDRHYVFKFCSPTRSAAQTGRNPVHVNVQNLDPLNYNPADPVSGMSAVPRNMTGVAEVMKRAGCTHTMRITEGLCVSAALNLSPCSVRATDSTSFFGKWDYGMVHAQKGVSVCPSSRLM